MHQEKPTGLRTLLTDGLPGIAWERPQLEPTALARGTDSTKRRIQRAPAVPRARWRNGTDQRQRDVARLGCSRRNLVQREQLRSTGRGALPRISQCLLLRRSPARVAARLGARQAIPQEL